MNIARRRFVPFNYRIVYIFNSGVENHWNLKLFYASQIILENPPNGLFNCRQIFTFCYPFHGSSVSECGRIVSQNPSFGRQNVRIVSKNPLFSLRGYGNEASHRPISCSVLVRSMVSIIQKTDQWDSLLHRLCDVSYSIITPPIAVQVIKRIRKPDVAFKFFEWLEERAGFSHDSLTYSAILKIVTKDSHPSHAAMADDLLHKKIHLRFNVTPSDFDIMLQQWVRVGELGKALELLDEMRTYGFVPSHSSCNVLLNKLLISKHKNLGWELFYQMLDGWIDALDTQTFNIVMKCACIEGRTDEAIDLFNIMKQRDCMPDLDSFNILIEGFSEKGDTQMICRLFKQMLDLKVKPDSYTVNLLIKELCKLGQPEYGNNLFNYMRRVGWIDRKFVYTQLVDSLCNYGWWLKGLKIFTKMIRRGHHPSISVYNNLICRMCLGGKVSEAFRLKNLIAKKRFMTEIENYNALMKGVCSAGRMDMANKLLHELQDRGLEPDLRMCNTVLRGHCMMKNVTEALELVEKIKRKGWDPDLESCNSLITSLMSEGKDEEAMQVKNSIREVQNIG
ncbi:putative pentatricopeptide repeat-containing protein At2g02150 [Macadamia integrifolia]|uniref:putative pentatricopeptide repeat-containing protein At2g02150 n=1 Tax=Macadamia integrifolia TaxID=60698 RepID=UPI001C4F0C16|nr:putative pentatricopeptide repeat-containing protein At2g02150 [Macadamia integrifolia]